MRTDSTRQHRTGIALFLGGYAQGWTEKSNIKQMVGAVLGHQIQQDF
jgi:hypothetical protein